VILLACFGALAGAAQPGATRGKDLVESADGGGMTIRMGRRLGPYRIGMERRIFEGLIRTIRQPRNDGPGCSGGFVQDSYVDVYPGLRLGYVVGFDGRRFLDTIATSRKGDRTSVGLMIGRSTRADIVDAIPASGWRAIAAGARSRCIAEPATSLMSTSITASTRRSGSCDSRPASAAVEAVEPEAGLEPAAHGLQIRCSTN
jgi:hypothetical protein